MNKEIYKNMFNNCRPLTVEEQEEAIKGMNKEKQIEEIKNCLCDVLEFNYSDESGVTKVDAKTTAEGLYNAGYRKASDVVREIFDEIELKAPFFCENQIAYEHFYEELAELKKKYTEEGE